MIEDPRDVERRRLLGIDDIDAPTRDELADALEEVSLMSDVSSLCKLYGISMRIYLRSKYILLTT